ncbi:MAG: alpha/beta hydrolase [Miltoncostaeaceae bacterium]
MTLPHRGWAARPGLWSLRWPDGWAHSSGVIAHRDETVVRGHAPGRGALAAGMRVLMDRDIYDDPSDLGIAFDEVWIPGELGPLPAWRTAGSGETVAVMLHGRGMSRREPLRYLPAFRERGIGCLLLAYRGDPEAPGIPDGLARLGATEWRDAEAAASWALAEGARRIVLVGMSLGGGMALTAARRSASRDRVAGVVLDAPFLQPLPTLVGAAERRGYPSSAAWAVVERAGPLAGIEFDQLDQVARADELDAPVLIVQGAEDRAVPPASAMALAERRPDLVDLWLVPGAAHVEGWNVDPVAHRARVGDFLDRVLAD